MDHKPLIIVPKSKSSDLKKLSTTPRFYIVLCNTKNKYADKRKLNIYSFSGYPLNNNSLSSSFRSCSQKFKFHQDTFHSVIWIILTLSVMVIPTLSVMEPIQSNGSTLRMCPPNRKWVPNYITSRCYLAGEFKDFNKEVDNDDDDDDNGDDKTTGSNSSLSFSSSGLGTWEDALNACLKLGGILATIKNELEDQSGLRSLEFNKIAVESKCWIGLRQVEVVDGGRFPYYWLWIDEPGIQTEHHYWGAEFKDPGWSFHTKCASISRRKGWEPVNCWEQGNDRETWIASVLPCYVCVTDMLTPEDSLDVAITITQMIESESNIPQYMKSQRFTYEEMLRSFAILNNTKWQGNENDENDHNDDYNDTENERVQRMDTKFDYEDYRQETGVEKDPDKLAFDEKLNNMELSSHESERFNDVHRPHRALPSGSLSHPIPTIYSSPMKHAEGEYGIDEPYRWVPQVVSDENLSDVRAVPHDTQLYFVRPHVDGRFASTQSLSHYPVVRATVPWPSDLKGTPLILPQRVRTSAMSKVTKNVTETNYENASKQLPTDQSPSSLPEVIILNPQAQNTFLVSRGQPSVAQLINNKAETQASTWRSTMWIDGPPHQETVTPQGRRGERRGTRLSGRRHARQIAKQMAREEAFGSGPSYPQPELNNIPKYSNGVSPPSNSNIERVSGITLNSNSENSHVIPYKKYSRYINGHPQFPPQAIDHGQETNNHNWEFIPVFDFAGDKPNTDSALSSLTGFVQGSPQQDLLNTLQHDVVPDQNYFRIASTILGMEPISNTNSNLSNGHSVDSRDRNSIRVQLPYGELNKLKELWKNDPKTFQKKVLDLFISGKINLYELKGVSDRLDAKLLEKPEIRNATFEYYEINQEGFLNDLSELAERDNISISEMKSLERLTKMNILNSPKIKAVMAKHNKKNKQNAKTETDSIEQSESLLPITEPAEQKITRSKKPDIVTTVTGLSLKPTVINKTKEANPEDDLTRSTTVEYTGKNKDENVGNAYSELFTELLGREIEKANEKEGEEGAEHLMVFLVFFGIFAMVIGCGLISCHYLYFRRKKKEISPILKHPKEFFPQLQKIQTNAVRLTTPFSPVQLNQFQMQRSESTLPSLANELTPIATKTQSTVIRKHDERHPEFGVEGGRSYYSETKTKQAFDSVNSGRKHNESYYTNTEKSVSMLDNSGKNSESDDNFPERNNNTLRRPERIEINVAERHRYHSQAHTRLSDSGNGHRKSRGRDSRCKIGKPGTDFRRFECGHVEALSNSDNDETIVSATLHDDSTTHDTITCYHPYCSPGSNSMKKMLKDRKSIDYKRNENHSFEDAALLVKIPSKLDPDDSKFTYECCRPIFDEHSSKTITLLETQHESVQTSHVLSPELLSSHLKPNRRPPRQPKRNNDIKETLYVSSKLPIRSDISELRSRLKPNEDLPDFRRDHHQVTIRDKDSLKNNCNQNHLKVMTQQESETTGQLLTSCKIAQSLEMADLAKGSSSKRPLEVGTIQQQRRPITMPLNYKDFFTGETKSKNDHKIHLQGNSATFFQGPNLRDNPEEINTCEYFTPPSKCTKTHSQQFNTLPLSNCSELTRTPNLGTLSLLTPSYCSKKYHCRQFSQWQSLEQQLPIDSKGRRQLRQEQSHETDLPQPTKTEYRYTMIGYSNKTVECASMTNYSELPGSTPPTRSSQADSKKVLLSSNVTQTTPEKKIQFPTLGYYINDRNHFYRTDSKGLKITKENIRSSPCNKFNDRYLPMMATVSRGKLPPLGLIRRVTE